MPSYSLTCLLIVKPTHQSLGSFKLFYVCAFFSKKRKDMRITSILTFLLFSISTFAQQSFSFDTIQVNSLQIPLKINETGRNITVLTSEQIKATSATSLDEVLQTVPGLEVQSRGGFGVQADISLRGSTFTQILMLIDGMKMNDPLTSHFNGYLPVTLGEIERIEILRGPAAAMYGPDAVGGVINIITKTFSNQKEGTDISGALNYGQHQLVSGQQGFFSKKGRVSISGGVAINQSEGEFFEERVIDSTTTLESYNNFFDIKTIGASFGYDFSNGLKVRLRSAYDFRDFGARYFYTTSTFDKSTEMVANWWNHAQISKVGNNSSTDFNVAYKFNTDEFVFSPDFPSTNNHTSQFLNFTLNHLQNLTNDITLKVGAQVDQRQIESNDRGDHEDWHYGGYAMGVYQKNQLNLSASLRGDYDDNYGFEILPQINFSYVFPGLVFRGAAGRSIRAADYTERYVSNNLQSLTPGRSLGNPDLLAERSWSQELGFDFSPTRNWQFKFTAFSRQSSNLIDYISTNQNDIGVVSETGSLLDSANYFFAQNVTDVVTNGIEAESWINVPLGENNNLRWSVGYTYLSTTNEEDVISVYISSHARHLFNTQAFLNYGIFDLSVNGLFKDRNPQAAESIGVELANQYMVWNTRLGINLTDDFGLNFQVQNIFDEEYQNILGAQMPGRWLLGGLKWNL